MCRSLPHASPGVGVPALRFGTELGRFGASLAHSHTVLAALARALVLCCNGSGDIGAVSFVPSPGHTCHHMCVACNRSPSYWRTRITPGPDHTTGSTEVDGTVPRGPIQLPVRPSQTASCSLSVHLLRILPHLGQLPCGICTGLFSSLCNPTSLLICPLASHLQRPESSRYCHSYPALVSINPSVDLRVHCVVHLTQDRFPYRSFGRLRLGKAAKGVAPVLSSETKCYAPAERCGVAQYFGQRETRTQKIPQRKDYIINKQNRLNAPGYIARTWAHYNTFRGAPFPR